MEWRIPWHAADDDGKAEAELARELCAGHVLFGKPVRALGYRQDRDDVAYELQDGTARIAVVHLTYAAERDPRWPITRIYEDLAAFAEVVTADNAEFEG